MGSLTGAVYLRNFSEGDPSAAQKGWKSFEEFKGKSRVDQIVQYSIWHGNIGLTILK